MAGMEFEKFAATHNRFISVIIKLLVTIPKDLTEYLDLIKTKAYLKDFGDIPPLSVWLTYYKEFPLSSDDIAMLAKNFGALFGISSDSINKILAIDEKLVNGVEGKSQAAINEIKSEFNEVLDIAEDAYVRNFYEQAEDIDATSDEAFDTLIRMPEMKFLLWVYLPCQVLYGDSPDNLFRVAQEGCIESIDKLLRIDPSVLGDPQIMELFHTASKSEDQTIYQTITLALKSPPKGPITNQKIKYKYAGLIALYAERFDDTLTAPEIETIFNALATDLNRPDLKLVESDDVYNDSIAKSIRREKQFWSKLLSPDKK